jgi:hypothetical protein
MLGEFVDNSCSLLISPITYVVVNPTTIRPRPRQPLDLGHRVKMVWEDTQQQQEYKTKPTKIQISRILVKVLKYPLSIWRKCKRKRRSRVDIFGYLLLFKVSVLSKNDRPHVHHCKWRPYGANDCEALIM